MTCTCRAFDIDKLPCVHAIAALHHVRVGVHTLASRYYMKDFYMLAYEDIIYSVPLRAEWNILDEVSNKAVLPRVVKNKKRGRPKTSRYPSAGESKKRKNRCKWCGELGQNQKTCCSETRSKNTIHPMKPPVNYHITFFVC